MEELGVPTISFVTQPFQGLGLATAKGKRIPDLPIVVLDHLYDQRPEDEIRADVRQRMPEVLAVLTNSGPG
ncbi:MAG: hypothetical protein V3V35_05885 [Dehalococcoidia bacterium]